MTKAATDWEAIELAYRAGVLSIREIAKQHGVTHGAVRKRAQVREWTRDLSAKVRKAVSTQLVSAEVSTVAPATERAAVEAAAATVVTLVREHRRDIAGQRSLAEVLKAQLEEAIGSRELLEELIVEETAVTCFCLRNGSSCSKLIVSGIARNPQGGRRTPT